MLVSENLDRVFFKQQVAEAENQLSEVKADVSSSHNAESDLNVKYHSVSQSLELCNYLLNLYHVVHYLSHSF